MASTIKLTSSALKSKKEKLEQDNAKFNSEIKKLESIEKQLMGVWKGDAADAFNATYTKDSACFEKFHSLVQKYTQALEQIVKAYEKAEKTNVQIAKTRSSK